MSRSSTIGYELLAAMSYWLNSYELLAISIYEILEAMSYELVAINSYELLSISSYMHDG